MVVPYRLPATPIRSAGILSLNGHYLQCKRFPDIPHLKQSLLQETQVHLQHFGETRIHELSLSVRVVVLALFCFGYFIALVVNSFSAMHRQGCIID
jgi:hypothetical protein